MRVENVKGAVWTVDEVEFYKRRPQRASTGYVVRPSVSQPPFYILSYCISRSTHTNTHTPPQTTTHSTCTHTLPVHPLEPSRWRPPVLTPSTTGGLQFFHSCPSPKAHPPLLQRALVPSGLCERHYLSVTLMKSTSILSRNYF